MLAIWRTAKTTTVYRLSRNNATKKPLPFSAITHHGPPKQLNHYWPKAPSTDTVKRWKDLNKLQIKRWMKIQGLLLPTLVARLDEVGHREMISSIAFDERAAHLHPVKTPMNLSSGVMGPATPTRKAPRIGLGKAPGVGLGKAHRYTFNLHPYKSMPFNWEALKKRLKVGVPKKQMDLDEDSVDSLDSSSGSDNSVDSLDSLSGSDTNFKLSPSWFTGGSQEDEEEEFMEKPKPKVTFIDISNEDEDGEELKTITTVFNNWSGIKQFNVEQPKTNPSTTDVSKVPKFEFI